MHKVDTIFSELLKLCPRYHFEKAVEQYEGDRYVKSFTTWQQYITILYAQITQKDSLRDIVTGLSAHSARWYHVALPEYTRARFLMPTPEGMPGSLRICFITFCLVAGT